MTATLKSVLRATVIDGSTNQVMVSWLSRSSVVRQVFMSFFIS